MSDVEVKVPTLGESVTEATVAVWQKSKGDSVNQDEIIVELETDKVSMEVTATCSGVIKEIVANEGDTVEIDAVLAIIEEGAVSKQPSNAESAPATTTPDSNIKDQQKQNTPPTPAVENKSISPAANTKSQNDMHLSPAARKAAVETDANLAQIQGSGKDGRITKGDILLSTSNPQTTTKQSAPTLAPANRKEERVRMTGLRTKIAERLKEAQNTAAILTTFNEVDLTNIMEIRKKYKDQFLNKHDIKLGFMSFFVKASIVALKEIPAINAEIDGNEIVYKNYYDIGVAVGTERGLVVPIVRNADRMSFAEIERQIDTYGKKARDKCLSLDELTGGSFTISNGGVYGSLLSTPIINPPQSGILGMHKIMERPVVIDGKIEIRNMMYLALSYDHRIIDGKEAVTFLIRVKDLLENPERLMLNI